MNVNTVKSLLDHYFTALEWEVRKDEATRRITAVGESENGFILQCEEYDRLLFDLELKDLKGQVIISQLDIEYDQLEKGVSAMAEDISRYIESLSELLVVRSEG